MFSEEYKDITNIIIFAKINKICELKSLLTKINNNKSLYLVTLNNMELIFSLFTLKNLSYFIWLSDIIYSSVWYHFVIRQPYDKL